MLVRQSFREPYRLLNINYFQTTVITEIQSLQNFKDSFSLLRVQLQAQSLTLHLPTSLLVRRCLDVP